MLLLQVVRSPGPQGHVGKGQDFALVRRPKLENGLLVGALLPGVQVSVEDAARVGGDADENVPEAVEVGEPDRGPGVAEQAVVDPAKEGRAPEEGRADAQARRFALVQPTDEEGSDELEQTYAKTNL